MSFSGSVEDRLAIRELIETYTDAVVRRDADAWSGTWTEDGHWQLPGGFSVKGRATLREMWVKAMDGYEIACFHASPGAIEVNGNDATARVYVTEILMPKGGALRRIEGAYTDTLRKEGGKWHFAHRDYRVLHDETKA